MGKGTSTTNNTHIYILHFLHVCCLTSPIPSKSVVGPLTPLKFIAESVRDKANILAVQVPQSQSLVLAPSKKH